MMRTLCLALVTLLACGNTSEGTDASVDASIDSTADVTVTKDASVEAASDAQGSDATSDATSSDAGPTDAGSDATDAGDAACGTACRLFSDYCSNAPCTCLALPSFEQDPACDAGMVTCFKDPCLGKAAVCTSSGCVVQ